MDLLIKNGTIVTAESSFKGDIAVTDEKITEIALNIEPTADAEVVDAEGKLVLPGAIDGHTHLAMEFGGTVSTDDYYTGTRSAACGGTTMVFDFAIQKAGESMVDTIKRRDAMAAPDACIDYSFHIGVADITTPELFNSMEECVKMGVPSMKVFMVYDFGVDDGTFFRVLKNSKKIGAIIGVHAENRDVNNALIEEYLSEGKTEAWWHYMAKNESVEGEADVRAINLAKMADAALYIAHLGDRQGMEAVTKAQQEGYPIFAETCPQYLHFTKDVYKEERGRDYVCSPPMKDQDSQDAVWEGVKNGSITTLATDHCPFLQSEKDWGITKPDGTPGNFTTIPNGCAGIENMYPYILGKATDGIISYERAVEISASNPAKLFGCEDQKGSLTVGKDADIVIYDPTKNVTIKNEEMHGQLDHTIWEGVEVHGYPVATYSRGKLVFKDDEFVGEKGYGKRVICHPVNLEGPLL